MRNDQIYTGYIDELQLLITKRKDASENSLKIKLTAVGRGDEIDDAEFDLHVFEMILERLTHYQSAQKLFFYFLSRILSVFRNFIMPKTANLSRAEIEEIIEQKIILPTLKEMDDVGGHAELVLTHSEIRGMINWLADRCHVRWQSC